MIDYGFILAAGFLAGLHCVGMCGTIVVACSVVAYPHGAPRRNPLMTQLLYNGGRVASYAAIGAIAGLAGVALTGLTQAADWLAIAGGAVMIAGGISMLGLVPASISGRPQVLIGGLTKLQSSLLRNGSGSSVFGMGFLTPLLPCGILYSMVAKAASTGQAVSGALVMGLFAAGTIPALGALGLASGVVSARLRAHGERLAGVLIILMGIFLLLRGFHVHFLPAALMPPSATAAGSAPCPNCAR